MAANEKKVSSQQVGSRYLCPQCFHMPYRNDVLFASDSWYTGQCDMRQAIHRNAFSHTGFDSWCAEGKSRVVMSWRGRPERCLQVRDGVVEAMQDASGHWLKQRVCPICHSLLPEECPILFGWNENGMSCVDGTVLFQLAASEDCGKWEMVYESQQEALDYSYIGFRDGSFRIGIPAGLDMAKTTYGKNCQDDCCLNVSGVLVWLPLTVAPDGSVDDLKAEQTLNALLEKCQYSGARLQKQVAILLKGVDTGGDAAKYLEEKSEQLFRSIQYSFSDVYFSEDPKTPQQATEILEWFARKYQG